MLETKDFRIERPNVREDGTFDGYLSVFGNKDRQGDIVEPGAFKRTLDHAYSNKVDEANLIPILWQHDPKSPIGVFEKMAEDGHGLFVNGRLSQGVRQADEAYILLRDHALKGLSIGYDVIKQAFERGARLLKELRLWEGSLVTFPANQLSVVTNVKAAWLDAVARSHDAPDFLAALEAIREDSDLWGLRDGLCKGVDLALDDVLAADGVSRDERLDRLDATLRQFHDAGMTWAHHFLKVDRPPRPTQRSPEMRQQIPQESQPLTGDGAKDGKPEGDYGNHDQAGYADPGYQADRKPRYPLKKDGALSAERVRSAWGYINHPDNASAYSPENLSKVKGRIRSAARRVGVEIEDDEGKSMDRKPGRKAAVTDSYTQSEAKKKPKRDAEDEHDIDPQDEDDQDDEHGEYEDRGEGYDEGDDSDDPDDDDDDSEKGDMDALVPGDDEMERKKPKRGKKKGKGKKKSAEGPMTQGQFHELREIMESLAGTMEKMVDHLPALHSSFDADEEGPGEADGDGSDDSEGFHSFGESDLTDFLRGIRTAIPAGE